MPLALLALCGKCSGRGRHKPKLGAEALVREIGDNKYVDSLEGREDADLLLGGVVLLVPGEGGLEIGAGQQVLEEF